MLKVVLDAEALSRVRVGFSPMWEVVGSIRLLMRNSDNHVHTPWVKWATPRIDADLMELVMSLAPNPDRFPDFLTPPPGERPLPIEAELAELAAKDPAVAKEEFNECFDGRVPAAVRSLLEDPSTTMRRLSDALYRYWNQVLLPIWPRVRRVVKADLAFRADELASGGLHQLLNRLHPRISFDGDNLGLHMLCCHKDATRHAGRRGLVLLPCVFGWPDVLVVASEPYPVTISYGPRGVGTLWQGPSETNVDAIAKLIGRTRASILALLDLPLTTSELAELTEMSQPAVSQHLAVLRRTGLIKARRSGRTVLNTRTPLGHAILQATGDGT